MNSNNNNGNNFLETKEFKLLYNLLEKAEQILSIINLPDSSISKYNTLKKLTFEMLNLEFKPLEKKYISATNPPNQNDSINNNIINETLYLLYFQYLKKTMLVDLMINFITNNNNNIYEEQSLNNFLNSLADIFNLSSDIINSKSPNDILSEIKSEESKLPSIFNTIDLIFKENFKNMKQMKLNYENELEQIKENYNKDFVEKNNSGKNKKFNKENNSSKNKKTNKNVEKNNNYLEKISFLIDESYEKFNQNFPKLDSPKSIAFKGGNIDNNILKFEFVKLVFDEFFHKNNYKKSNDKNNLILNNGNNCADNNNLIEEICSNLPEIQKENDIFHKNFNDLMNYIETNIEGKII